MTSTTTSAALIERALRLPERDLVLLEALHEHRFLTTGQMHTLYFDRHPDPRSRTLVPTRTRRAAQRRLAALRQHGLVYRRFLRRPGGGREPEPYHCLSRAGARLVAYRRNLPAGVVRGHGGDPLAAALFVRHALAGAEFTCALVTAARGRVGHDCEPDWWRGEHSTRHQFRHRGTTILLCPDGYTRYQAGQRVHHLLVEIDLGTTTLRRLQDKLDRYRAYARADIWQERYPVFPKLLLLTSSERRLQELLNRLEPIREYVLLCATHTAVQERGPLAPIWQQPYTRTPRGLLEQ